MSRGWAHKGGDRWRRVLVLPTLSSEGVDAVGGDATGRSEPHGALTLTHSWRAGKQLGRLKRSRRGSGRSAWDADLEVHAFGGCREPPVIRHDRCEVLADGEGGGEVN